MTTEEMNNGRGDESTVRESAGRGAGAVRSIDDVLRLTRDTAEGSDSRSRVAEDAVAESGGFDSPLQESVSGVTGQNRPTIGRDEQASYSDSASSRTDDEGRAVSDSIGPNDAGDTGTGGTRARTEDAEWEADPGDQEIIRRLTEASSPGVVVTSADLETEPDPLLEQVLRKATEGELKKPGHPPGSKPSAPKRGRKPKTPGLRVVKEETKSETVSKPKPKSKPSQDDDGLFSYEVLTPIERAMLGVALAQVSDLMDQGLWHLGLETDIDLGGRPIWHLDDDEIEILLRTFDSLASRNQEWNHRARQVIVLAHYYQSGMIVASRLWETGVAFYQGLASGFHFRLSRREAYEEWLHEQTPSALS